MSPSLADALLNWYDQHARVLPWRSDPTPYHVWVSEIMLQQTRVDTVLPYYDRFLHLFPDVTSLANAAQADVLKTWEGLGYYSRARSLHKAARVVSDDYGGELPSDFALLRKLPGVGSYTAAAIASIAFGQPRVALDGNLRRVLARLTGLASPIGTPESDRQQLAFAQDLLPAGRAGDFNQALMDLGANVCQVKGPRCEECPVSGYCQAFQSGRQDVLPVKMPKAVVPHYNVTAAVIAAGGRLLIAQRPQGGLLGGMWEFPGGKLEPTDADLAAGLRREIKEELGVGVVVGELIGVYKHAYTHFRITLHAFHCRLSDGEFVDQSETVRWVALDALDSFAMGKVDRLIANHLVSNKRKLPGNPDQLPY